MCSVENLPSLEQWRQQLLESDPHHRGLTLEQQRERWHQRDRELEQDLYDGEGVPMRKRVWLFMRDLFFPDRLHRQLPARVQHIAQGVSLATINIVPDEEPMEERSSDADPDIL